MSWHTKYWDIVDQYYWSPRFLGLESISRRKCVIKKDYFCVPRAYLGSAARVYVRREKKSDTIVRLQRSEEVLNQFFDITFAIAPDTVISELLFKPVGITDHGPFRSIGREISNVLNWGNENITQQDALFQSSRTLLGVELKLNTSSSLQQILKYLILMVLIEREMQRYQNLGLLFIIRDDKASTFWRKLGLTGPTISIDHIEAALRKRGARYLQEFISKHRSELLDVISRLCLAYVSWSQMLTGVESIIEKLDQADTGQQTLYRLLIGFADQLRQHNDTGIHQDSGQVSATIAPDLSYE